MDTFKFLWRTTRLSTQRVGPKGINLITPFMTLLSIKSWATKKESSESLRQHSGVEEFSLCATLRLNF